MTKTPTPTIKPLHDHVLIRRKEGASKHGSILIPSAHKEIPQEAEVLAIGSKCIDVKPGDVVLFAKYSGTEVKSVDGSSVLLVVREEDILGVVER